MIDIMPISFYRKIVRDAYCRIKRLGMLDECRALVIANPDYDAAIVAIHDALPVAERAILNDYSMDDCWLLAALLRDSMEVERASVITSADNPFGSRVKALRKRRGVSLRWVAHEAGISLTYLWEIEHSSKNLSDDILMKLADVFGVTMDELYRGIGRCEGI
jgi:DNA-binding XRE family transcriptional regulator